MSQKNNTRSLGKKRAAIGIAALVEGCGKGGIAVPASPFDLLKIANICLELVNERNGGFNPLLPSMKAKDEKEIVGAVENWRCR